MDESTRDLGSAVGARLFHDIAEVPYPCLFIDIGSSRLPHLFDGVPFDQLSEVQIGEIACAVASTPDSPLEELPVLYWDLTDPEAETAALAEIGKLLQDHTFVSHNAISDLWLLRMLDHRCGTHYLPSVAQAFCTMFYGVRYSTCHVYRGGKKVPKWPHLQVLYRALTGIAIGKGTIEDDLALCVVVFELMLRERREAEHVREV